MEQNLPGDSSDEEDDMEYSQQGGNNSFHQVPSGLQLEFSPASMEPSEKTAIPLMDYIVNVVYSVN